MNAIAWLDESFSLRLALSLLHFLWQGALIAAVVGIAGLLLKRASAQQRYAVNLAALLLMTICVPVNFAVIEAPRMAPHNAAISTETESAAQASEASQASLVAALDQSAAGRPVTAPAGPAEATASESPGAVEVKPVVNTSVASATENRSPAQRELNAAEPEAAAATASAWIAPLAAHLTAGYYLGVALMLLRLGTALQGGRKLRSASTPVNDHFVLNMVARQARRIGLKAAPAIGYCQNISVPIVVGVARPMILLPAALVSGLSPDQLEALLTHELAHLRRCDPVVNLVQRTVEAVLFFHPAVWYVSGRVNVERENASDDLVLAAGWRRVAYADALVRMAELSLALRKVPLAGRPALLAASGASTSEFKRRVMRLLGGDTARFRLNPAGLVLLLLVTAACVLAPPVLQQWTPSARAAADDEAEEEKEAGADGESSVGRRIAGFELRDHLGAEHKLADLADRRAVVVAFLGVECPLAKLYAARLAEMAEQYGKKGVAIIGIDSNQQDTPTEIASFVRRHKVTFPMLVDPGNRVADQFRAQRTPEVFLLDERRVVRFWGRIDDQFGVGYARPQATKNFLSAALDELLAGKAVSRPVAASVGCHIGRVAKAAPTGDITYANQISRILQRRCVECHRDEGIAPFPLASYEDAAGWAETMREVVQDQRMPPWHADPRFGHFSNDGRMPDEEKQLLYQWVENGVPQGDTSLAPPQSEFVDGWSLGEPDMVISMPQPFTVAPNGVMPYQYITVDPGFTEGRWVRASEVRPGVRSVVHHAIVFINPPGGDPILQERGIGFESVGSYVPGAPPMVLKDGVARYVPAGSTFVFQMHYTPDGAEQHDQSEIGLYFADPSTVRRTMQTGIAVNLDFAIPAQAQNHRVEATHRFGNDMELHALIPHMHYRGKAFRFEAVYPNGAREVLLDVPRYDFNWQNTYRLAAPKLMPEGTLLKCVAHFDNSEFNLSNPDPTETVRWGEQTWDEMMIGYFEGVFLNQDLSLPAPTITPLADGDFQVRFAYRPGRPVNSVNVAGTFNDWNLMAHPMSGPDEDGFYTADVKVKAGPHRYKFVVDGDYWTHDPASRILTGFFHESFFVAGQQANTRIPE